MSETNQVIIHVRFAPNGSVTEIGERPGAVTPTDWFNLLTQKAGENFQPLSGGRGVFRIERALVDEYKASAVPTVH